MFEAYRDRREAGHYLGQELLRKLPALLAQQQLQHLQELTSTSREQQHEVPSTVSVVKLSDVVVLGLVRGGMPVADEVARALRCPCDAYVVRKVGAPMQPEFGLGAISEGGHYVINATAVESVGATQQEVEDIMDRELIELQRRVSVYRRGKPHIPVKGKTVVLVDDGLATGVTARAACEAMRGVGAACVVLAVPVGSESTVEHMREDKVADVVVCLRTPARFRAVGAHYMDFSQTSDAEVVSILQQYPHPDTDTAAQPTTPQAAAAAGRGRAPLSPESPTAHAPAAAAAARTSSLSSALSHHHSGEAAAAGSAAAAAAAAVASPGLQPVTNEELVITDSETGMQLHGCLTVPENAFGLVVFAHGSGSSRNSPRNLQVAATLNRAGLATLLFDLLTPEEAQQRHNVFDIHLLASRLQLAVDWLEAEGTQTAGKCPPDFPLGFFGASTGGGAALWAAAYLGPRVSAVVVRGGRPDLAASKLPAVIAPTLLLVGGEDTQVLELNSVALQMMGGSDSSQMVIVPGAGHLFEGEGQLEQVAAQAVQWFRSHMGAEGVGE